LTGDSQTFLTQVWGRRVHRHDLAEAIAQSYLSLADADHLVTSAGIRTPALRVVKDGAVVPETAYTQRASLAGAAVTGLIDPRRLLEQHRAGATIVFQGLQRYWPPITALIGALEQELGHPCQANAYLTPAGAQGFGVHADGHDVFVLQTGGAKDWQVHLDSGVEQVHMVPGRCLYLPSGTRHAARTQDAASLHLTLGVQHRSVHHVLRRAVDDALKHTPDVRLPGGLLADPDAAVTLVAEALAQLVDELTHRDPAELLAHSIDATFTSRPSRLAGALLDLHSLDTLEDRTRLRRRETALCQLRLTPDSGAADSDAADSGAAHSGQLRLLTGDREIRMPSWLAPAMTWLAEQDTFTPHDLAEWLDPQSRLVLCRRLVREGVLRIDNPQAPTSDGR